jgi:hypothetical protein
VTRLREGRVCLCRLGPGVIVLGAWLVIDATVNPLIMRAAVTSRTAVQSPIGAIVNATVQDLLMLSDEDRATREVFRRGSSVVPELATALSRPELRARAGKALAYSGDADGLRPLFRAIQRETDGELRAELSAYFVGALVQTNSREYRSFLAQSIRHYRTDGAEMVAAAAALTLGTMRTRDALSMLRAAKHLDEQDLPDHEIAKAQRWISTGRSIKGYKGPSEVKNNDDRATQLALANAFYAEGEEARTSADVVVWNVEGDRALVEVLIYEGPKAAREYHVIVERAPEGLSALRISGVWFNLIA